MAARQESLIRWAKYRELLDVGSKIEAAIENDGIVRTLKKITSVAKRSDELRNEGREEERLENTTEIVIDAQVTKMTHDILGAVVEIMDKTEISDDEFVSAINRLIGPNKDWDKLSKIAVKMSKTITYSQPLFGTFNEGTVMQVKEKTERRKPTKTKNTQQVQPKSVAQRQKKEEQRATTANVVGTQINQLFELNNKQPLPYYALIIDPNNFMRTVQNAFQLSFLFREGHIVIEKDEHGYPTVRPANEIDKNVTYDETNYQLISNMSTKLCEEMIQRYDISEPMMSALANEVEEYDE